MLTMMLKSLETQSSIKTKYLNTITLKVIKSRQVALPKRSLSCVSLLTSFLQLIMIPITKFLLLGMWKQMLAPNLTQSTLPGTNSAGIFLPEESIRNI